MSLGESKRDAGSWTRSCGEWPISLGSGVTESPFSATDVRCDDTRDSCFARSVGDRRTGSRARRDHRRQFNRGVRDRAHVGRHGSRRHRPDRPEHRCHGRPVRRAAGNVHNFRAGGERHAERAGLERQGDAGDDDGLPCDGDDLQDDHASDAHHGDRAGLERLLDGGDEDGLSGDSDGLQDDHVGLEHHADRAGLERLLDGGDEDGLQDDHVGLEHHADRAGLERLLDAGDEDGLPGDADDLKDVRARHPEHFHADDWQHLDAGRTAHQCADGGGVHGGGACD
jgi:hypothetical protein